MFAPFVQTPVEQVSLIVQAFWSSHEVPSGSFVLPMQIPPFEQRSLVVHGLRSLHTVVDGADE